MIICMFFVCAIAAGQSSALQWASGLQDGDLVYSCKGHDISLPWNISLATGENITDVQWLYRSLSEQMIAMYAHGLFLPAPTFSRRVRQVPEAGLVLTHATTDDEGNYTVEVTTRTGAALTNYRRSAVVHVATEATARIDATMKVRQEPKAVYNDQTNQYHVQLTCTSQGRQPPAVIWTSPAGSETPSSDIIGSAFSLLLPNPVSGGNYTCRIHPDAPAAKCLPSDDPTLHGDTVYVDEVTGRLTLIEAQQGALASENALLKENVQNLTAENAMLKEFMDGTMSQRVNFHAKLSSTTSINDGRVIVLATVTTNQGNSYNKTSGYFTAPYNGTYVFLATTGPYASSTYHADLDLVVSSNVVSSIRTTYAGTSSSSHGTPKTGSCHAVVHLTSGQEVWLRSAASSYFDATITTFSGYLLSPDGYN